MKCPKCRCEITNHAICPYCGFDVRSSLTDWSVSQQVNTGTAQPQQPTRKRTSEYGSIMRRLSEIETRVNLSLILLGGNFIFLVLVLIIMAFQ